MNQLDRTIQTMLDCQQDTTLVINSNAAQQQDAANSITSTNNQNNDQLPIVCLDDAVGIINTQWQQH